MKRSGFKRKATTPLKRTKLRLVGHSTSAEQKREIQALLREIVIKRDGGCVLRDYAETGKCGGYGSKSGKLILQFEHLHSRSHSISFGDSRLGVLLCQRHHIFWKPQYSQRYWEIIEEVIGPTRWDLLQKVRNDHKPYKMDWKLVILGLKKELNDLQ